MFPNHKFLVRKVNKKVEKKHPSRWLASRATIILVLTMVVMAMLSIFSIIYERAEVDVGSTVMMDQV